MFPIMTPQDYKEVAKRERHRQIEAERAKRIFNAKERLIGMDLKALEAQVKEKKERERQEILEEEMWNNRQAQDMLTVNIRNKQLEEDRKKAKKELNEYRCRFQKYEDRREYDLNSPQHTAPLGLDPNDLRFGISSITRFEGDEEFPGAREKAQLQQKNAWLHQQIMERHEQKVAQKKADEALMLAEVAEGKRYRALKELENQCRDQQLKNTAAFNKAMAIKRLRDQYEEMKRDAEEAEVHTMNVLTSSMLLDSGSGGNALGPGRMSSTTFKGMTEETKAEIKRIQLEQIAEKQEQKRREEAEELAWIDYQLNLQQTVKLTDMKLAAQDKAKDLRLLEENRQLMEEQKARKNFLDRHVYANNQATDDFFKQFNKTTR